MRLKVFGSEKIYVDGAKLVDENGNELNIDQTVGKMEIDFFGKSIWVTLEWIVFVTNYSEFIPKEIIDDPERLIVTKNIKTWKPGSKNSYVCWFREPIEYRNGYFVIARFPNYAINKEGHIISIKTGKFIRRNLYLYLETSLMDLNASRTFRAMVHRLVLFTFDPPKSIKAYNERPIINHIDGDKSNPRLENLEWCSDYENIRHAVQNNLIPSEDVILLDIVTNKEHTFPSLQEAAAFIGIRRLTISDVEDRLNQKPFKGRYKVQLKKNFKPWTDYNRDMYIVIQTDNNTGESYTFPDMRSFKMAYGLWNKRAEGGVEEMVKLVNDENPDVTITFRTQYERKSKIEARNVETGEVFTFESIREASRKLNVSFTLVLTAVLRGDKYQNGGYQFRRKVDRAWFDKPKLGGKKKNQHTVTNIKTGEVKIYESEREFCSKENLPYFTIGNRNRRGIHRYGDFTWTVEEKVYEMGSKFKNLQ